MTSRIKLGPPDYVVLGMIRQGAGSGYAIVPEAERLAQGDNAHPLLTLRMGIAFHQAIIEVCGDFAKDSTRGRRVR